MKKLEIKTEKATLLVVDDSNWDGCIHEFVGVNYNGFKHLGKVSEITEEEWNNIIYYDIEFDIDEIEVSTTSNQVDIIYYNDYVNKTLFGDCTTASESGLSLLKANGVVMEYDFDDCPNDFCENGRIDMGYNESMTCSLCEEEQEKVWSNPHVFIKVD